ncbi:MAG: hypothetical protein WAK17_03710 [Candidatus Nitrosopolaris sp.]
MKTKAIAEAKIKTDTLPYEISTCLSYYYYNIDVWLLLLLFQANIDSLSRDKTHAMELIKQKISIKMVT